MRVQSTKHDEPISQNKPLGLEENQLKDKRKDPFEFWNRCVSKQQKHIKVVPSFSHHLRKRSYESSSSSLPTIFRQSIDGNDRQGMARTGEPSSMEAQATAAMGTPANPFDDGLGSEEVRNPDN